MFFFEDMSEDYRKAVQFSVEVIGLRGFLRRTG